MKKLLTLFLLLMLVFSHTACLLPELPIPSLSTTTNNGGGGGQQPELPPFDNDTASYGYYYDQLSGNEKAVYRAIYKNARAAENITFTLESPIAISTPESEGSDTHGSKISTAVRKLVQPAMDALSYDHPEISWIAYGGEGGSSFSISVTAPFKDDSNASTSSFEASGASRVMTKVSASRVVTKFPSSVTVVTEIEKLEPPSPP